MKALSIRQPWAYLIIEGHKPVENRSWTTTYKGPLLIHASWKIDDEGLAWVKHHFPNIRLPNLFPMGEIVGKAELVGCLPIDCASQSPWAFGPYCWYFLNPQKFERSIIYRGRLGLFDVPDSVLGGA